MTADPRTLVLGWGNPGRLDDGLGPAFTTALANSLASRGDVAIDTNYQLTIEDAAEVARYDRVLFVDADCSVPAPFRLGRITPGGDGFSFSTHSVSPEAVLVLCRDLFDHEPEAWLLGIRGYDFDAFGEELSDRARLNLAEAVTFVRFALDRSPSAGCGGLREVPGDV